MPITASTAPTNTTAAPSASLKDSKDRRAQIQSAIAALRAAPNNSQVIPVKNRAVATCTDAVACEAQLHFFTPGTSWVLTSQSPLFGGLSSLVATNHNTFMAISDLGWLVELEWPQTENANGTVRLLQTGNASVNAPPRAELQRSSSTLGAGPVFQLASGLRLTLSDPESLAILPSGAGLVAFESVQRVWRYGGARGPFGDTPVDMGMGAALTAACPGARGNLGVEALVALNATHVVSLCEGASTTWTRSRKLAARAQLWRLPDRRGGRAQLVRSYVYPITDGLLPGDMTLVAANEPFLLVLERRYVRNFGVVARLQRVGLPLPSEDDAALIPQLLGELCPGAMQTDNFEGVAAVPEPSARHVASHDLFRVLLLSDNNFRPAGSGQRTLFVELLLRWPPRVELSRKGTRPCLPPHARGTVSDWDGELVALPHSAVTREGGISLAGGGASIPLVWVAIVAVWCTLRRGRPVMF